MRTGHRLLSAVVGSALTVSTVLGTAISPAAADGNQASRIADAVSKATSGNGVQAALKPGSDAQVAVSTTGATQVTLPKNGNAGVTVTKAGVDFKVGLPTDASGTRTSAGTMVYADTRASSSVAAQALTDGSARVLVILSGKSAPKEYRFPLTLPADTSLAQNSDGSIDIVNGQGWAIGQIQAPWAKDANGVAVSTSYRVEGNTVVQIVQPSRTAAYPVVADPTWGWTWYPAQGPTAYMNKGETAKIADTPYWELTGIIAGYLAPNPAMAALAATQIWAMKTKAQQAKSDGKCVKYVLELAIIEGFEYTGGNCH